MSTEKFDVEHLNGKVDQISLCGGCNCMTKTIKGKCGKCKAKKSEKAYTEAEVLEIIKNLPRIQKSLQIALQTVLSVLEDVAMVIRAIPPEMIREAVELDMEEKLRAQQYGITPRAIEMNVELTKEGVENIQKLVELGIPIPEKELK